MLKFSYENLYNRNFRTESEKMLDDLANLNLIKFQETEKPKRKERKFGSMKGLVVHIAEDFDAPLEDFKDYT